MYIYMSFYNKQNKPVMLVKLTKCPHMWLMTVLLLSDFVFDVKLTLFYILYVKACGCKTASEMQ